MAPSTYSSLMDAIQKNNSRQFYTILRAEGLPVVLWWLDYELLMRALEMNRRLIVGYLLESGCCVWKPYDKTTPLHLAVAKQADWHDVVEKLLCLGARVSAKDKLAGDTPVHVAFKNNAPANVLDTLVRSYLDETTVSIENSDGLGVLHIACTRPTLEYVQRFFQYRRTGIDSQVSLKSNSAHAGYTPLHFAVEHGRHEVVTYLLERGADMYLQDKNGSTPLHLALEFCDVKMINRLCYYITKFGDVVNSRGLSHFMAACASNDPSLVEKYLAAADAESLINKRVTDDTDDYPFAGYTALHFAAVYDRVHIARMLLYCHGEELFWAATARNHTASSLAFERKKYRMAKLFSVYCEGGDVWMKEIEKIDDESVVRKIAGNVEDESFSSCCDFVESENLDDTLSADDDDDNDCEEEVVIDVGEITPQQTVNSEASIELTPRSTRSFYRKRDEIFFARVQDLQRMSRRMFFYVDRDEEEYSKNSNVFRFLFAVRPASIIVCTLIILWLSSIVPLIQK